MIITLLIRDGVRFEDGMKTRKDRFIEQADHLLRWVDRELGMELPARPSGVDSFDLETASELLKEMRELVEQDHLPPKAHRHPGLVWLINDHWPLGTELGNKIGELEAFYEHL